MDQPIKRADGWHWYANAWERTLMADLLEQVQAILLGDIEDDSSDPTLAMRHALILEALLPEAYDDPILALSYGSDHKAALSTEKSTRAADLVRELRQPSGEDGSIHIAVAAMPGVLGALNDVRRVLAVRLGIETDEDAASLAALVRAPLMRGASEELQLRQALAIGYEMVTWWQESLLSVLMDTDDSA